MVLVLLLGQPVMLKHRPQAWLQVMVLMMMVLLPLGPLHGPLLVVVLLPGQLGGCLSLKTPLCDALGIVAESIDQLQVMVAI